MSNEDIDTIINFLLDHYWDSLEEYSDFIILHLEECRKMLKEKYGNS